MDKPDISEAITHLMQNQWSYRNSVFSKAGQTDTGVSTILDNRKKAQVTGKELILHQNVTYHLEILGA